MTTNVITQVSQQQLLFAMELHGVSWNCVGEGNFSDDVILGRLEVSALCYARFNSLKNLMFMKLHT